MEINIAICDDQVHMLEIIDKHIKEFEQRYKYTMNTFLYKAGKELLKSKNEFDVVFLDIELEQENGLDVAAEYILNYRTKIIFLTSHIEEMPNGYKVRAFRFLLKPINEELFFEALKSAVDEISMDLQLIVSDDRKEFAIRFSDIIYVEAGVRSCGVRTAYGFYRSSINFEGMKKELSIPNFFSPHRSYIVNFDYVDMRNYINRGLQVCEGEIVKVSRLKEKEFKDAFFEYIRSK